MNFYTLVSDFKIYFRNITLDLRKLLISFGKYIVVINYEIFVEIKYENNLYKLFSNLSY